MLLLERSETPIRKPCGEGLFPRGVRELARLDVLDDARTNSRALTGVRFHSDRNEVAAPFGPTAPEGLGIRRTVLDPLILARARAAGVEVRTGVVARGLAIGDDRITGVRTDGGDVPARVVVAADGIGSRMRHAASLDRPHRSDRYGVSAHVQLNNDVGRMVEVYLERGAELYVTPVDDRIVNVAVLTRRRSFTEVEGDLRGWFTRTVGDRLGADVNAQLLDDPLAAGPFGAACVRPWRENLVLVGDAAGFADAISGEGMSTTLVSARQCAAAVDQYLDTRDQTAFRRYAMQRRSLVRNSDLLGRMSLALAAYPSLGRLAVNHLSRRPASFARMVAVSTGELPFRALRLADFSALLLGR